jgi:hypothetical protein
MNECKKEIIEMNSLYILFLLIVNSLAYRLLWPSETDRQIISGIF